MAKEGYNGPVWSWDGNTQAPTVTPSLNVRKDKPGQCHFNLTNGMLVYCQDSDHEFKGMSVPIPNWDDDHKDSIKGTRVFPNALGFIEPIALPGDYGRLTLSLSQVHGFADQLWWQVRAPDGSTCKLDPSVHTVTEHEDGTITVMPSIVTSTWHGWLTNGYFISVP
jgi:hypothetical protein